MVKLRFVEPVSRVQFPLATQDQNNFSFERLFCISWMRLRELKDGAGIQDERCSGLSASPVRKFL